MKLSNISLLSRLPSSWRARIGITLAVGIAVAALERGGVFQGLEWMGESVRLKARAWLKPKPPTGDVVLIGVDERTLHDLGRWPLERSIHGQLMDWLGRAPETHPSVLGWDILFTEETSAAGMDAALIEPLARNAYPVVMGAQFDEAAQGLISSVRGKLTVFPVQSVPALAEVSGGLASLPDRRGALLPIADLLATTQFGFLNADADDDGLVRRFALVVRVRDRIYPSIVLAAMMSHLRLEPSQVEILPGDAVVLRPTDGAVRRIPIDVEGNFELNYRYELKTDKFPNGIPELPYSRLHETLLRRVELAEALPAPPLQNKIALIGQTAIGLSDIGPSPLTGQSAKVFVHINALENILSGDYLRRTPSWPWLCSLLAAGLGAGWVLDRKRVLYFAAVAIVVLAVVGAAFALLCGWSVMIPLAVVLIAVAAQQMAITLLKIREEQAQRDRIRKMFGSYVSPELVRRMVEARVEPQLGGHEEEITAFFSDIQGFSAFSEVLSPADLVQLLNEYLGAMTDILQDNRGALDKYIGDAIVAMFGGLLPSPDHARHACESAAKMQIRQAELRKKWTAQGDRWPPLVHAMRTRIGLNSGRVVVGNMGSAHRFNYTMMGDAVNLAARCESGAKTFGVYTVATGFTVAKAKASGCQCVFRELDRIVVKGRNEPVEIFEVTALSREQLPAGAEACLERFAAGRAHYLRQEWDAAIACFTEASAGEPLQPGRDAGVDANPSLLMIERCRLLQAKPPGPGWDGIYKMTTK